MSIWRRLFGYVREYHEDSRLRPIKDMSEEGQDVVFLRLWVMGWALSLLTILRRYICCPYSLAF